jgi:hypothetical protein
MNVCSQITAWRRWAKWKDAATSGRSRRSSPGVVESRGRQGRCLRDNFKRVFYGPHTYTALFYTRTRVTHKGGGCNSMAGISYI